MIKKFLRVRFYPLWKILKINLSNVKLNDINKEDKKIFIFLAADYPNLGDIAITYAQKLFLKDNFPDYKVIEIPCNKTFDYLKNVKKNFNKEDYITIVGGGNVGNKYPYYEELRLTVVKYFSKNKIICFPQTVDFSNDIIGQKTLRKSLKVYSKCKRIVFMTREKKSYNFLKEYLGEKVKLYPDIVLYLKDKIFIEKEKKYNVGLCFRNDIETCDDNTIDIERIKEQNKENVINFDTVMEDSKFIYENRYEELFNMYKLISECNLIYTNRLHALIFSYILNVNCIFLDNSNKKLSGVYETWLSDNELIKQYNNINYKIKKVDLKNEFKKMKIEIEKR